MNTNDPSPLTDSKGVSTDIIKGDLKLQLSRLGFQYETILQAAADITFSKETLDQDFTPLKKLRELSTKMDDLENPFTARWKAWNEAKKSIHDPVKAEIATKTAEYTKLAKEIKEELENQAKEEARVKGITDAIASFTIDFAGKTASATTVEELTALQMRIGTEKSRKGFWQEYLPEFIEACKGLENGLKTQKEKLKNLKGLEEKEKTATDEQLLDILDKKEALTAELEQGKTDVREGVINNATAPRIETVVATSSFSAPKPRRTSLDWEVSDISLLQRRHPELVSLEPKSVLIDALTRKFREDKTWPKGQEVFMYDGIKFFEKYSY